MILTRKTTVARRMSLRCGFVTSTLILAIGGSAFAQVRQDAPATVDQVLAAEESVRNLVIAFRDLPGLRLSSQVEIELHQAPCADVAIAPLTTGQFSYVGRGQHYHVASYMDPAAAPGMQIRAAWNGPAFQLLTSAGVLSLGTQAQRTALPAVPNPIFELVRFTYPLNDANRDEEPTLDLLQDSSMSTLTGSLLGEWTVREEGGEVFLRGELPGDVHDGRAYVHHLYLTSDDTPRIVRVDRVSGGRLLSSARFANYVAADAGSGMWPRDAEIQGFDESGQIGVAIRYSIDVLDVSGQGAEADFLIDRALAHTVWNDALLTFERGN